MHAADLQPILDCIARFSAEHGYPPSYAEIAEECELRSVGHVQYRVNRLIEQGRLARSPGRARSLRLVDPPGADVAPSQAMEQNGNKMAGTGLARLAGRLRRFRRRT